jgi:hypothetical protein
MIKRFLAIDLTTIQAQTHATLTALRGLVRWSRLADQPELWTEIESRYQLYTDFAWTETYANYNWFNRPRWTEPCAVVDSLMVAMELWHHTRKIHYLEHAQLIWFNALGHAQRANGGFGCDNCPGADGEADLMFRVPEAHWCCTMRGAEALARMCGYQGIQDGTGLLLPFGLPGDFQLDGTCLQVRTTYPHGAEWTFSQTGAPLLRLRLFVPSWIKGLDASDSWITLDLSAGASITLEGTLTETSRDPLPATTSFNPKPPVGRVRRRGPLLLARYGEDWEPICNDYLRGDMSVEHSRKVLLAP